MRIPVHAEPYDAVDAGPSDCRLVLKNLEADAESDFMSVEDSLSMAKSCRFCAIFTESSKKYTAGRRGRTGVALLMPFVFIELNTRMRLVLEMHFGITWKVPG